MKIRVLGKVAQLLVQYPETLSGYCVGIDVIDADLQILEAGVIEPLDTIRCEVVAVGYQPCKHPVRANVRDDLVQLRMHHWLSA